MRGPGVTPREPTGTQAYLDILPSTVPFGMRKTFHGSLAAASLTSSRFTGSVYLRTRGVYGCRQSQISSLVHGVQVFASELAWPEVRNSSLAKLFPVLNNAELNRMENRSRRLPSPGHLAAEHRSCRVRAEASLASGGKCMPHVGYRLSSLGRFVRDGKNVSDSRQRRESKSARGG